APHAHIYLYVSLGHIRELHSSLHDALPISGKTILVMLLDRGEREGIDQEDQAAQVLLIAVQHHALGLVEGLSGGIVEVEHPGARSEEHTSELQSRSDLVCRLLLEKKKSTGY